MKSTGLATGLTALAGSLGLFDGAEPGVTAYVAEQQSEVAARHIRFGDLTPAVLRAFADAEVVAIPVKGAVLGGTAGDPAIWPDPGTRPMSDIDVLVPVRHRAQATAVLERAGWPLHATNDFEDTFLAWGDGGTGRLDGESADHNGRIEVHPGWVEYLHGYTVHGFDIEHLAVRSVDGAARLDAASFAVHVIGHLASTVVRAEVRAVNVLDVFFLDRGGLDWDEVGRVAAAVDPRLVAPGLWLIDRLVPDVVPAHVLQRELARLPGAAALASTETAAVLRDPGTRTTARWRSSFAVSVSERTAVVRQLGRSAIRRLR